MIANSLHGNINLGDQMYIFFLCMEKIIWKQDQPRSLSFSFPHLYIHSLRESISALKCSG